jgi:hypothetical protein
LLLVFGAAKAVGTLMVLIGCQKGERWDTIILCCNEGFGSFFGGCGTAVKVFLLDGPVGW